jgi:CRP-like cAMP-binding protein
MAEDPLKVSEKQHFRCCEKMELKHFPRGSILAKYKDLPTEAYITISGEVKVFISKTGESNKDDLNSWTP